MPLNQLMRYPDIVPMIPGTGVQFLDFGFNIGKDTPVPRGGDVLRMELGSSAVQIGSAGARTALHYLDQCG